MWFVSRGAEAEDEAEAEYGGGGAVFRLLATGLRGLPKPSTPLADSARAFLFFFSSSSSSSSSSSFSFFFCISKTFFAALMLLCFPRFVSIRCSRRSECIPTGGRRNWRRITVCVVKKPLFQ